MPPDPAAEGGAALRLLRRVLDVRAGEVAVLGWSFLYIFAVLSAYYVIRPIRDEMGAASGIANLPWLFTATLVAMLALTPAFGALVKRLPRRRFIAWTYRFFAANLVVFMLLFSQASEVQGLWLGRVFFVWASVFNLFVVSVFWQLMVDVFDSEQGKRLFGFLAAGASLGAILGSTITVAAVRSLGPTLLLLASVLLLEVAVFAVGRLSTLSEGLRRTPGARAEDEAPIGGTVLAGISHTLRQPYLLGIGAHMLLFAVTSTFLYFQQIEVSVKSFGSDRAARTAFFAQIDLLVNVLTLVVQLFLTRRILGWLGVGLTLAALPALSVLGFAALALAPTIGVLVALQVARRVGNFALTRPTRELLFTVVSREDKYKAKSVIDTAVYRGGDQIGSWAYAGLGALGLGMAGVAWVAVPLSALWLVNSLWLGRRQEARAREESEATAADTAVPAPVAA